MKNLIFTTLLLTFAINSFSQNTGSYIPNYVPPSPEASSLGKFVDHPVGNFTGTAAISIPLLEIKCGRIKVPISLNYHASGVKVDEIASRSGIGWALNAGGFITRTVKGLPDDAGSPYTPPGGSYVNNGNGYFYRDNSNMSFEYLENDPTSPMQNDLEPDIYFYTFGNKSGKLFFSSPTSPITLNKDMLKIDGPFNGSNRFIIKDDDGLVYTFAATEGTWSSAIGSGIDYTSSWYITKIEDPVTQKTVQFVYRTDMPNNLGYSTIVFEGNNLSCTYSPESITNIGVYAPKVLQKIIYDEGYVEFKADYSRTDLAGDKAYTEIDEYINKDNTAILKKGFNFNYYTSSNGSNAANKRLYLENVTEKGADNSLLPPYQFFYKNRDLLPERLSPQQDIWGYYNANGATVRGTPKIYYHNYGNGSGKDYLPFDDPTNPSTSVTPGIDRASNASVADYGTLNKIIYPTKGYTLYNYELHSFDQYTGGGIRVKSIADYSSSDQPLLLKNYTYNGGFLGGAYPQVTIPVPSGLVYYWVNRTVLGSNQGNYVGYASVAVKETSPTNLAANNGIKLYTYTTDRDIPGTFVNNGNSCADLSNLSNIQARTLFPFFEWESRENRRGLLTSEISIDNQNNYVKGTNYTYTLSTTSSIIYSNYVLYNPDGHRANLIVDLRGSRNLNSEKKLLKSKTEVIYHGNTGDQTVQALLGNVTEYTYTEFFPYNDVFVRSETHHKSNAVLDNNGVPDKYTKTIYQYPFDYINSASGAIMNTMVDMNYISPVVIKFGYAVDPAISPDLMYTSGEITNYKHNPFFPSGTNINSIVPAQVYTLNTSTPIKDYPNTNVFVADPANPGAFYEKRLEYLDYNYDGNPTQIVNDGKYQLLNWSTLGSHLLSKTQVSTLTAQTFPFPPQSWNEVADPEAKFGTTDFVWTGYNTAFPLRLDGQSNTTVSFWAKGGTFNVSAVPTGTGPYTISQTAPSMWKYYSFVLPTYGQDWTSAQVYLTGTTGSMVKLDNVAIITGGANLTTTYTYDDLKRLQSTMDPNGNVKAFEYDVFGRLMNTRDQNNNILKHIDYHYKGQ